MTPVFAREYCPIGPNPTRQRGICDIGREVRQLPFWSHLRSPLQTSSRSHHLRLHAFGQRAHEALAVELGHDARIEHDDAP